MQFSQERNPTSYTIRSYSAGQINVTAPLSSRPDAPGNSISAESPGRPESPQEVVLTESFIMTPERLIRNWPPQNVGELSKAHLDAVTALEPEVILLGTGEDLTFPDQVLTFSIMSMGIGVEVMNTAAACRTYNILMNEGRRVALAILV